MNTFLITFGFFLAVIAAMAVGYIFQRKVVKGSCGGLGQWASKKSAIALSLVMHVKNVKLKQPPAPSVLRLGKKIGSHNSCYRIKKLAPAGFLFIRLSLSMAYYYTVYVYSIGGLCKTEFVKSSMSIWTAFSLPLKCGITLRIER